MESTYREHILCFLTNVTTKTLNLRGYRSFGFDAEGLINSQGDFFDVGGMMDAVYSKNITMASIKYLEGKTDDVMAILNSEGGLATTRAWEGCLSVELFVNEASNIIWIYGEDRLKNATHFSVSNFESIILKNKGNGGFKIKTLPKHAQFSPTLGLETHDINNDGYLDIFGVGNVFNAEVETIRYDASKNYVLLGDKNNEYTFTHDTSYFSDHESKAIKKIMINNDPHFIIITKNKPLTILKLRK